MLIPAILIIGGLLVVILGLSGDLGNETAGIILGTALFIIGLMVLRRQKSDAGLAVVPESRIDEKASDAAPVAQDTAEQSDEEDEAVDPVTDMASETEEEDDEEDEDEGEVTPPAEATADRGIAEVEEGNYIKVATTDEIQAGTCKAVDVEGKAIVLFNLDGEFYAMNDNCTHARAALSDGDIEGDEVLCPLHGATFNIKSGEATGPPAEKGVKTYPVRITGTDVEVAI